MILWMAINHQPEHTAARLVRLIDIFTTREAADAACKTDTDAYFPIWPTGVELPLLERSWLESAWQFCSCCDEPFPFYPRREKFPGETAPSHSKPCHEPQTTN